MALILSAASGNFNAGATWVGGVVPTIGDEAQAANGHTVTITANTTCDMVSNAGTGKFVINSGVTLTANVQHKGSTANTGCIEYSGTGASPRIVGNLTGGTAYLRAAVLNAGSGSIEIQGNCVGGADAPAVLNNPASGAGTITISGNLTGGTAGNGHAVLNTLNGSIIVTSGNVIGGAVSAINNLAGGSVTVNGNVTGGTAAGSAGVRNSAGATAVTITGTCTGGTNATASGIINVLTGSVTLNGNSIGGTGTSAGPGVQNSSTGNVFVTRAVGNGFGPGSTGISAAVGVANAGLGIVEIQALEYGTRGQSPTSGTGIRLKKANSNVAVFNFCDTAGAKTLIDATTNAAMPAASDVRSGVSYASGALTGSCAVPAASSVAFGVPVDNTSGTAVLTPAAIRAELATELGRIDQAISSRLAAVDFVAPANSDISAIKSKTDNLPASPAAVSDIPTTAQISAAVEGSLLNEGDGQAVLNAIVGAIGNQNLSEVSLVAAIRSDLERTGGKIDSIPTTAAPTAAQNASAVWGAATRSVTGGTVDTLTNAPASVTPSDIWSHSTRTLTSASGPTAAQIRQEMDSNSTQLSAIKAKTDNLPSDPADQSLLEAAIAGVTAPTAGQVASQVRTELSAELTKVAALNTERLANVATTAIVGNLIAQANS
jgi:hypothetical protein